MRSILSLGNIVPLFSILVLGQSSSPVRHLGQSASEALQLCLSSALGKPVVISSFSFPLTEPIPCPAPKEIVFDALRQRSGLAVFESDDWVYLIPLGFAVGRDRMIEWTRFEIRSVLGNLGQMAVTTRLQEAEWRDMSRLDIARARLVPITISFQTQTDGKTGIGQLVLDASLVEFDKTREFVVGVFSEPFGPGRLFLGRREGSSFSLAWDSPLFNTRRLGVGFQDVDGDGVPEIVLRSSCCGLRPTGSALTIFTVDGDELTRQTECELDDQIRVDDESAAACPIVGEGLSFEAGPDSTRAIAGYPLGPDSKTRPFRYVLKDRRFRPVDGG